MVASLQLSLAAGLVDVNTKKARLTELTILHFLLMYTQTSVSIKYVISELIRFALFVLTAF